MCTVISGVVCSGAVLCLEGKGGSDCIRFKDVSFLTRKQRVFAYPSFGPTNVRWFSVVLVKGANDMFRRAYVILLFHMPDGGERTNELALGRYYEITRPADKIEKVLNCICFRWLRLMATIIPYQHHLRQQSKLPDGMVLFRFHPSYPCNTL